jgi:phenylpropionate dioxygenase-like ring-hydroxylating dioxygenase large terminal subunit
MTVRSAATNRWQQAWYPVAFLKDLDPQRPNPFTLMGQDLVLWFDRNQNAWSALADVCPHRLVPLSDGRINAAGELECPYHGWSFDGQGLCSAIPQASSGSSISQRSHCQRYATASAQGLLFVFSGDPEQANHQPLPLVPELDEPGWVVQDTFRDLPMDALTLLENVLDVSHVPFTHHATVGRRENAGPVELELSSFGPEGFTGLWQEGPRRGKLGSQFTTYAAPSLMWHDLSAKGFARILTVVYATPIRAGECRLIARFPFQFASPWPARLLRLRPQWLQHLGNHVVLEDDQLFLHWQERVVERRGGRHDGLRNYHLPTRADRYVRALHDWVNRYGGEPFAGEPLPARLSRSELMERFDAHTRHCRSCSTAYRRLQRGQPICWGVVAAALISASWLGPSAGGWAALVLALAAAGAGLRFRHWLQGLRQGSGQAPRNR